MYYTLARRALLLCTLLLASCAAPGPGGLVLSRSIQAQGQDSRVGFVVIHYTATGNEAALKTLTEQRVSSHYLITREPKPTVYQLVDDTRRAWHAGLSEWYGRTYLNSASIGIEIVNLGREGNDWQPYTAAQIDVLVKLLKDRVAHHGIDPRNVVGHSDIAPQRKQDPGPLFPWKTLAEHGIGRWYDETMAAHYAAEFEQQGLPNIAWAQEALQRVGYQIAATGILDDQTRNVLSAFQMHYRPTLHDGYPDAQTLGILKALR